MGGVRASGAEGRGAGTEAERGAERESRGAQGHTACLLTAASPSAWSVSLPARWYEAIVETNNEPINIEE